MSEVKSPLLTFADHGVHLKEANGTGQAWGECPFCGKAKFSDALGTLIADRFPRTWELFVEGRKG